MINYQNLHNFSLAYAQEGYARVEVPWTVTQEISRITKPVGAEDFELVHPDHKVLVASGEQSFLYQYSKGFLPRGKLQTITPCFRKEPHDGTHQKTFMKLELIDTSEETHRTRTTAQDALVEMVHMVKTEFERYLTRNHVAILGARIEQRETPEGFDLNLTTYDGWTVEIGSYGIRSCDFISWVYGTGVAEPRFSSAIERALNTHVITH